MVFVVDDALIMLVLLGVLGVAWASSANSSNSNSSTAPTTSSSTQTTSGAINPQNQYESYPPLLYDPLIDQIPTPSDIAYKNNPLNYVSTTTTTTSSTASSTGNPYSSTTSTTTPTIIGTTTTIPQINAQNPAVNENIVNQVSNANKNINLTLTSTPQPTALNPVALSNAVASAKNIQNAISNSATNSISQEQYQKLSYGTGIEGVATVPALNQNGRVVGVSVINNATANQNAYVNLISTQPGNSGTSVSTNQIIASTPNTVVGYQGNLPVYAAGSSYQGPGDYISGTGVPEGIGSQSLYNNQVALGFLGTVAPSSSSNSNNQNIAVNQLGGQQSSPSAVSTMIGTNSLAEGTSANPYPYTASGSFYQGPGQYTTATGQVVELNSLSQYNALGGSTLGLSSSSSSTSTTSTSSSSSSTTIPPSSSSTTSTTSTTLPTSTIQSSPLNESIGGITGLDNGEITSNLTHAQKNVTVKNSAGSGGFSSAGNAGSVKVYNPQIAFTPPSSGSSSGPTIAQSANIIGAPNTNYETSKPTFINASGVYL